MTTPSRPRSTTRPSVPFRISRIIDAVPVDTPTAAYGSAKPELWIAEGVTAPGRLHVAFVAKDRFQVQAFDREALAAGGTDIGAPGYRPYHPGLLRRVRAGS